MTQGTSRSSAARRLVVIDGANTMYRAFFAIPSLRAPDGLPTNAAYGFVSMLNKVLREESPDFVAVAFDPRGGSFRKRIFDDYKAGRDAQPEDLSAQIPVVRELLEAFRIPLLEVPDFEADDVIAALVKRAPEDVRVTIISTDKDLMQLVSDRVHLLDGVGDRRYGPAEVEERFGVTPDQMLDLRALVGDPSDNIPGVKGIGAKGAAKLIDEWGTLEALIANADQVKTKRAREALLEQADQARLSKRLATLRDDIELGLSWEALAFESPDRERLRELYKRLGFSRLLAALDGEGAAAEATESASVSVEVVTSAPDLERLMDSLADQRDLCALWISGHGSAVDAALVGVAFAVDDQRAAFVPFVGEGLGATAGLAFEEAHPGLESLFEARNPDSGRSWIGSGVKQAQSLLAERGLSLPVPVFDLEVAAFLLDPAGEHQVSALARPMLGRDLSSWEQLAGRGAKAVAAEQLPTESLAHWAGAQVCAIRALHPLLWEKLERDELLSLFRQVEMPLTRTLSRMERAGVRIDEDKLASLAEEYRAALERLEEEIYRGAGERFLVNSPKQLQVILFEKLKLPAIKKTKTGYSTAEGVLEQLVQHHELPGLILAWRRLSKLMSTYIAALPPLVSERSGRIHPHFHQTGAATGRLSASHPNVQNIPIRTPEGIRVREAFVPEEGFLLLSADYSQVELRILAHYSGDSSLVDAFSRGEDIHRRTAAEVAGIAPDQVSSQQRDRAKAVNFGIIYGSSAFGLAGQLGIAAAEAQETIDAYFERYRGVRRFIDETIRRAKQQGYVTTLLGRRRYLPDLNSRNRTLRQAAERMATNTVIQGTAADLIKKAMVEVDEALRAGGYAARMILQVHDELVFEVPETEVESLGELARSRMQEVFQLKVPLVVDAAVGRNWREAH
jgi:DNA polymerase-1